MIRFYVFIYLSTFINQLTCDTSIYAGQESELTYQDKFNLHHAFVIEKHKWKDGVVYFRIDKNFSEEEIKTVLQAMYEIETNSCIRFAAHNPNDGPNFVMIRKTYDNICESDPGFKKVGKQYLSLDANGCMQVHIIMRLLLYTLGFGNHHQRSDRDKYININKNNIRDGRWEVDFEQFIAYDDRFTEYLTQFDYNSTLLYRHDDFSKNNESVITPKMDGYEISPSKRLTHSDKILLNRLYDCVSVGKRGSKIFYQSEPSGLHEFTIKYNEIARAKGNVLVQEITPTKENVPAREIERVQDISPAQENAPTQVREIERVQEIEPAQENASAQDATTSTQENAPVREIERVQEVEPAQDISLEIPSYTSGATSWRI